MAFGNIHGLVGQITRMLSNNELDGNAFLSLVALLPAMGLFAPSLMLPAIFKFGAEKGRFAFYVIICVFCAAFGVIGAMGEEADLAIVNLMFSMRSWFLPVICSASVIVLAVSWILSIQVYKKREF